MDWKENIRKYWWVGAIILGLLLVLRPRQQQTTTSRLSAIEEQVPTGDGIMEQTLSRLAGEEAARASRLANAQEALALQQIETQKSLLGAESAYQMSILKGQTIVQERLADKASKVKFACPDGTAKIDPATGQMYCRQERTKGMSIGGQSIFGAGGIFQQISQLAGPFVGSPVKVGTPPIAGTMPGLPTKRRGIFGLYQG